MTHAEPRGTASYAIYISGILREVWYSLVQNNQIIPIMKIASNIYKLKVTRGAVERVMLRVSRDKIRNESIR